MSFILVLPHYMPNSSAPSCSTPILSFTPSINVKDATSACPWFTCNYLSWSKNGPSGQCTSQGLTLEDMNAHGGKLTKTIAEFPCYYNLQLTTLDSFLAMTINFVHSISLAPGDSLVIYSCIYYDNWPRCSPSRKMFWWSTPATRGGGGGGGGGPVALGNPT